MPLRPKSRLTGPKRRRTNRASTAEAVPDVSYVEDEPACEAEEPEGRSFSASARTSLYAMLAWLPDYGPLLRHEAEENGATDGVVKYLSSHRAKQLKISTDSDAFWKSAIRVSRDQERQRREQCVHYISFSQVCADITRARATANYDAYSTI